MTSVHPAARSDDPQEERGCWVAVPARKLELHQYEVLAPRAFELLQIPVHCCPSSHVLIEARYMHSPTQHVIVVKNEVGELWEFALFY